MNTIDTFLDICRRKNIKAAIEFQKSLRSILCLQFQFNDIRTICAFDISYEKTDNLNFAAAVVMTFPQLDILEKVFVIDEAVFPYVPGLLAFREGPAFLRLYKGLENKPDLLLFDGHGIAHPRGMGIAAMIGIMLDVPSIGCAKTRLIGQYTEPDLQKGERSDLNFRGQKVGHILRTRNNVKPVFVSKGHKIDLDAVTDIVLGCCRNFRLPEPIREAHKLANEIRKNYIKNK